MREGAASASQSLLDGDALPGERNPADRDQRREPGERRNAGKDDGAGELDRQPPSLGGSNLEILNSPGRSRGRSGWTRNAALLSHERPRFAAGAAKSARLA
jgi:hypothetical protein